MIRNITEDIKRAIAVDTLWSIDEFYVAIEQLTNVGWEVSHWENEEAWANIATDNAGIGLIWRRYPLIFIASVYAEQVMTTLSNLNYIVWISFSSVDSEEFCIDMDKDLTDRLNYVLDYKKFSADDFWFSNT